ncbi:MAG: protease inhibitor I42 family protein [Candidatus Omnitrophica bacterium]|nr:protease inhibitor I42 family protein [Candidatus Omnitrophota bacterium]MDD5488261.1 protease inhibitor I42 family protein [Candidatus Omnitrophota bacterium]
MSGKNICFVILAMMVAVCAQAEEGRTYGIKLDKDAEISVPAGAEFTVKLDSNPTTGYLWEGVIGDGRTLKFVKEEYNRSETDRVGVGGEQVFVYKAIGPGPTNIRFSMLRPWEVDQEPDKEYTLTVNME